MNALAERPGARSAGRSPERSLEQRRIERALAQRERYRYVHPCVQAHGTGWRIVSPCCSRRVDPNGGVIDIAWLQPLAAPRWRLHARDHDAQCWRAVLEGGLAELLDRLARDPLHQFWL